RGPRSSDNDVRSGRSRRADGNIEPAEMLHSSGYVQQFVHRERLIVLPAVHQPEFIHEAGTETGGIADRRNLIPGLKGKWSVESCERCRWPCPRKLQMGVVRWVEEPFGKELILRADLVIHFDHYALSGLTTPKIRPKVVAEVQAPSAAGVLLARIQI